MTFVFSFWDLALWLASSSLVMLVASELMGPYFGRKNVLINVEKLRMIAIIFSVAFIFTIAIRIMTLTSG